MTILLLPLHQPTFPSPLSPINSVLPIFPIPPITPLRVTLGGRGGLTRLRRRGTERRITWDYLMLGLLLMDALLPNCLTVYLFDCLTGCLSV